MKIFLLVPAFLFVTLFTNSQQLMNGDFERWRDTAKFLLPFNWSPDLNASLYYSPSSNAQQGKYALILSTWYSYVEGHLHYGNFHEPVHESWTDYTVPFTGKPVMLTGYYRYTDPVNFTDSAGGQVLIKDIKGDTLAYGFVLLDTAINWTKFEIPLIYHSVKPAKSIAIHFTSREAGGGMNDDSYPNRLWLDNLKLLYKKL